jgi:hypothetical protein
MMFSLAQPMVWDCLIVGLVLLGVFDCWVIIGIVWLLGYRCWECLIVGISLAEVTKATIAYYCMGKITIRVLLPLGTEVL